VLHLRSDLDMKKQRQWMNEFKNENRSKVAMAEWRRTCAKRDDHRIMLQMLIAESFRLWQEREKKPPATVNHLELVRLIDDSMADEDNYVSLLTTISKLGLFSYLSS